MSFTIKLPPKPLATAPGQSKATSSSSSRKAKRKQVAVYSDDEDEESGTVAPQTLRSTKRMRTEDRDLSGAPIDDAKVDVDGESEVDLDQDDPTEDTRFLPASSRAKVVERRSSRASSVTSHTSKGRPSAKRPTGKKKRAVVLSDEEAEDDYTEDMDVTIEVEDEDFKPDPSVPKRPTLTKGRGLGAAGKIGKAGKPVKSEEKETVIRDERKSLPSAATSVMSGAIGIKRPKSERDEDSLDVDITTESIAQTSVKDSTPPPPKKRKLPTIKKNKPSVGGTPSSTPSSKPAPKATSDQKDNFALPVPTRKSATTATDFDLRDKSVYAQLFTKPGGSTPNSGLNRKEKEEERRKELSKMRDDARAKRAEETKSTFDLQAAQEKIQRFEEKLHERKSIAIYPNILGAAFKDAFERAKRPTPKDSPNLRRPW